VAVGHCGKMPGNHLESSVWNKVLELLFSPLTLLSLLTDAGHADRKQSQQGNPLRLMDKQIHQLRRKLKTYPAKERKLYDLLPHEAVTKDYVLDAVNKLKQERLNDERQLKQLLATRKEATKDEGFTFKLSELSKELRLKALQSQQAGPGPTDNLEVKRRLLEGLRLEISANPQSYQFSFKLGGQIISTSDTDDEAFFNQALKQFEQQHPNTSIEDLLAINKQLPENTPFAKIVNQVKQNLVTIEQTWASLFNCRYSYIEGKGYALSRA
jgi:hypothetical protein